MDRHLNRLNLEWVDQGLAMDHLHHYQKDRGMVLDQVSVDQDLAMAPAQVLALVPALVLARAMVKARA